jgi:hypothetical protein
MDEGNALSFFCLKEGIQYMNNHRTLFIATALIVFGVCSAQAAHKDVKHCADDYRKYCHEWGLETKGLANCIAALVRAGEVSQAEVDRRKKQLGR